MKIVELIINELEDLAGFSEVALVHDPAIEVGFQAFSNEDIQEALAFQVIKHAVKDLFVDRLPGESQDDYLERCIPKLIGEGYDQDQAAAICYDTLSFDKQEFESYTDYPKQATENAKIALRWAEENGWGDCGTPVGKQRANQLAKGEPISEETIARMAAFERHRQNSDKELGDGCGRLMWLAWGGDAGIEWAQRKLESIREDLSKDLSQPIQSYSKQEKLQETLGEQGRQYAFAMDDDQMRVIGPAMIPNKLILRVDEEGNPYYVFFTEETIRKIAYKMIKEKKIDKVNLEHNAEDKVAGYLEESWIVEDSTNDKSNIYGFSNLPVGSWMVQYKIQDPEVWKMVKNGDVKAFSIEGWFSNRLVQN